MSVSPIAAICDFLHVTVPYEQSACVSDELLDLCLPLGLTEAVGVDGVWRVGIDGGTLLMKRRGPVLVCGFSGAAIAALRSMEDRWAQVLAAFGAGPHRVTKLDAAYDLRANAPPVLWDLYERGKRRGIRLGRIPSPVALVHWRPGSTGEDTGTVRIGTKCSELKAKVYDKRQERIDAGRQDPGPWVRYEITLTDAHQVSLRDAWDPTDAFWHFAYPALLAPPAGCDLPLWEAGGGGFPSCQQPRKSPLERLEHYLEASGAVRHLCKLVAACGKHGKPLAIKWFETAFEGHRDESDLTKVARALAQGSRKERDNSGSGSVRNSSDRKPTYAEFRKAREEAGW